MAMTMQIKSDILNSPTTTSNISQRRPTQVSLDNSSDSENEDTTPYRFHFIVTNPNLQSETSLLNTVEHINNDNDNTEQENDIVNSEKNDTTELAKEPTTNITASLNIIETPTNNAYSSSSSSTTTTATATATTTNDNNKNNLDHNEISKKDDNEKATLVQIENSSTSTTDINNETLKKSIQENTANIQQQQNNNDDDDKINNNSVSNGLIRRETKVLVNDSSPSPVAAPSTNLYTIPDIEIQPHPQRASIVEPVSTQNINRNVIINDNIKNHNTKGDDDHCENISSPTKSIIINTIRPHQDQDQTTSTLPPPVPIKDHLLKQKDKGDNGENKTMDQLLVREANNISNRHSQSSLYMEDNNNNNNNNNQRNSVNTIESHDDNNKKRPLSSSSAVSSSQQQHNILTADLAASGNTNKYNRASHSLTKSVEAIKLYREMAEKTNNVQVQLSFAKYLLEVAELYRPVIEENGNGNSKDDFLNKKKALEEEGVRWIHLLSKKGVGEAAYLEAVWMEEDLHGYKTRFKFKIDKLYQTAIQAGVPEASYRMALRMENAGNENTHDIFELYLKSANQNCIQATYKIAKIYLHGELGQRQNLKKGLEYLTLAVKGATTECNEPPYVFALLLTQKYSKVVIPSEILNQFGSSSDVIGLLEQAADLGCIGAKNRAGHIYEHGSFGTPMNIAKAFTLYDDAANNGRHLQSMLALSRLYNRGCHGPDDKDEQMRLEQDTSNWFLNNPQNQEKAFYYCQRAANGGLPDALYVLGWYYEIGLGVPRHYEYSIECYQKAAKKGQLQAKERLAATNNNTYSSLEQSSTDRNYQQTYQNHGSFRFSKDMLLDKFRRS
ncbi:unnamed protein product [Cunninghamella echinulata]